LKAEGRMPNAALPVTPKNPQRYPELSTALPRIFLSVTRGISHFAAVWFARRSSLPAWLHGGAGNLNGAEQQRCALRFDSAAHDLLHDLLDRELKTLAVFQHRDLHSRAILSIESAPMKDAE